MAKLAANRRRSPADVHFRGHKTDRRMRVRHTSLAAFSPGDGSIAGLVAWYDYSDINTLWKDTARTSAVTADGDIVLGVTDKSGNGKHLSEATNGPTYKVNIINSKSVARFDGTNDILRNTSMSADTSYTVFIVAQKRTAPSAASRTLFSAGDGGSDNSQLFTNSTNSATAYNYYANQAVAVTVLTGTATNVTAAVLRVNSAASVDFYANGGSATNFDPNDLITTGVNYSYGANSGSTVAPTDSDICETVIYNSALVSADLNTVGNYLASKWGFTWTAV